MPLPTRRPCVTQEVGPFAVTVSFVDGHPCEMFITKRAKSGTELEEHLYDLGVTASRIMQGATEYED